MKILFLILFAFAAPCLAQNVITEADRARYLKEVREKRDAGLQRILQRSGGAYQRFRLASTSDKEAFDLWLECTEKVEFEEKKLGSQAFREWKRENADLHNDAGFRRALRHFVRWHKIALDYQRAKQGEGTFDPMEGLDAIEDLLNDRSLLGKRIEVSDGRLGRRAYEYVARGYESSVFSQRYGIQWEKGFVGNPLEVQQYYSRILLPEIEQEGDVSRFRKAYIQMLNQLQQVIELKERDPAVGDVSAAMEKYKSDDEPELLWQLEVKSYAMGDKKASIERMITLLSRFPGHEREVEWAESLIALLNPKGNLEAEKLTGPEEDEETPE